jgi:hypothetical protein
LYDFVGDLVVGFKEHFDFGMIVFFPCLAFCLLCQIHAAEIVVGLQQFLQCVSDQSCLLFETTQLLTVDEQVPQLVPVDVFFKLSQNSNHWLTDAFEFLLQAQCYAYKNSF